VYPNGEMASIINTETEKTIPIEIDVIIAIHQNWILQESSRTPCQKGARSIVAVVEGGIFGLLGIKNVGIVKNVEIPATIMSYRLLVSLFIQCISILFIYNLLF
jgi:hypothetical protein